MKSIWQVSLLAIFLTLVNSNTTSLSSVSSVSDMTSVSSIESSSIASISSSLDFSAVSNESVPADMTANATSATTTKQWWKYSKVPLEGNQSWIVVVVALTIVVVCTSSMVICGIAFRKYWCQRRSEAEKTPTMTPLSPTSKTSKKSKKTTIPKKIAFPVKPVKKMVEQLKEPGGENSKLNVDKLKKASIGSVRSGSGVQANVFEASTPVSVSKSKQTASITKSFK